MNKTGNENDLVLPDRIGSFLLARKQTAAVAESVTAGHLQVTFSLAENALQFFQGGISVYNLGQKARHLNINPILAASCNCVSEEVAAQMAKHVCELFLSDWGIAITGYASPVPEKNIFHLFACYAFYFRDKEMARKTITVEKSSPLQARLFYTSQVLTDFQQILFNQ
jgi:PncC family amidohydrolase